MHYSLSFRSGIKLIYIDVYSPNEPFGSRRTTRSRIKSRRGHYQYLEVVLNSHDSTGFLSQWYRLCNVYSLAAQVIACCSNSSNRDFKYAHKVAALHHHPPPPPQKRVHLPLQFRHLGHRHPPRSIPCVSSMISRSQ